MTTSQQELDTANEARRAAQTELELFRKRCLDLEHIETERNGLRKEIDRLRSALKKYGKHITLVPNTCTALMGVFGGGQCSCGLNEALAAPKVGE